MPSKDMINQFQQRLDKLNSYLEVGMKTCGAVAEKIVEKENDEVGKEKLSEVEDAMLEFCKMDQEVVDFSSALVKMQEELQSLDEDDPVDLEDLLDKRLREARSKSKKHPTQQHDKYLQFKDNLMEKINNAEDSAEDAADTDASQAEAVHSRRKYQNQDDDVEISQADVIIKCPITTKVMEHPVKNNKCNHHYEREAILRHIELRKSKARCPIGGCQNQEPITEADLVEDRELMKHIQRVVRESQRNQ